MAKVYVNTVKYQIAADFEIDGIVDKHDIIGAIFGQSEGLIGEDLDLRELQKSGKLGRIEVKTETHSGKTTGTVTVPSSMDTIKTALLAASIESVDKVGPCDSEFKIIQIEDMRTKKREAVQERAKELLKTLTDKMPETTELTESIRSDVRTADLKTYGREKLSAGPDVEKDDEIIIVEGRADVINLLKHGIKNAVAIDGAKIPSSIISLSKKKTVTAFVDGDRGGDLIARKLIDVGSIEFIAKAPTGKEVEELAGKEIMICLKKRLRAEDFGESRYPRPASREREGPSTEAPRERDSPSRERSPREYHSDRREGERERPRYGEGRDERPTGRYNEGRSDRPTGRYNEGRSDRPTGRYNEGRDDRPLRDTRYGSRDNSEGSSGVRSRPSYGERSSYGERRGPPSGGRGSFSRSKSFEDAPRYSAPEPKEDLGEFAPILKELDGSLKARLYGKGMKLSKEVDVRDMLSTIEKSKNIDTIVFDGIVTKRMVEQAEKSGVKTVVAIKKGKIEENKKVKVLTSV